jgi:nitroreductase
MTTHALPPQHADAFADIIRERRSIRAFLPEPLPRKLLEKIFALANHAPSNCNSQPWLAHVVSGDKLEILRKEIPAAMIAGQITMDFPYDGKYSGVYRDRQVGAAEAMFDVMGIKREDKVKRNESFMRNFVFFDAPHVVFLFIPDHFGIREAADIGMYAQSLMLAFTAHSIGCVPMTALGFHADLIRKTLHIDASQKLLFGITFGYTDRNAPVNQCRTNRATVSDNVVFHS